MSDTKVKAIVMSEIDTWLVDIIQRASDIHSRHRLPIAMTVDSVVAERNLKTWKGLVTRQQDTLFTRRLDWEGWSYTDAIKACTAVPEITEELPAWATMISDIVVALEGVTPRITDLSDPDSSFAFEHGLLPIVEVARSKSSFPLLFAPKAQHDLLRVLLRRLSKISAAVLNSEFLEFRPFGQRLLILYGDDTAAGRNELYLRFCTYLIRGGWKKIWNKYPVLAKLMATTINLWIENIAEFSERLKDDWNPLCDLTGCKNNCVISIQDGLSDLHRGNRSVMVVLFDSGQQVVYKPKSLALDKAFRQFQILCEKQPEILSSLYPDVLDRDGYGWVQYVAHEQVDSLAAVHRYFTRVGQLLCLLYVLGATDCHHENLIASGEHPILVDVETLLHPEARRLDESEPQSDVERIVYQQFSDSVLRTGLLPRWEVIEGRREAFDASALGAISQEISSHPQPQWKHKNTDAMHLAYEFIETSLQKNVLRLNGQIQPPTNYLEDIITGFTRLYKALINTRLELLQENISLTYFRNVQPRFLFRMTRLYSNLLRKATTPEALTDGLNFSLTFESLAYPLLLSNTKPNAWHLLAHEQAALHQFDIPYFVVNANSPDLEFNGEVLRNYFEASPFDKLYATINKLGEEDLSQQIGFIRGSFFAHVARGTSALSKNLDQSRDAHVVTNTIILQSVAKIAEEIRQQAIVAPDGSITWIGLVAVPEIRQFQYQPLGATLYSGQCGIALFLAAYDFVHGTNIYLDLVEGALYPLRDFLRRSSAEKLRVFARMTGLGGASGLGSLIYSFLVLSRWLPSGGYREDAVRIAELITESLIAEDQVFDVMGGSAGALLALLDLWQQTSDPFFLNLSKSCGQHLLEKRVQVAFGCSAWPSRHPKPLSGFAHGVSGVAYALSRLHKETDKLEYLMVAEEAYAYEMTTFDKKARAWRDLRYPTQSDGSDIISVGWCNGAPGILLGRVGVTKRLDDQSFREHTMDALNATLALGMSGIDHVCCGRMGRVDALLSAANRLKEPDIVTKAHLLANHTVAQAIQNKGYRLFENLPPGQINVGFFQGTAGIGYTLLRLFYSDRLPSILLLE